MITGTCEHTITRLVNGAPSESCLITPDTGVAELKIQLTGGAQTIQGLAVINHNIPADATLKLYFSVNGETWGNETPVTYYATNFYRCFDFTNEYIKLRVETAGSFYIGEVFPGTKFQFPGNWDYSYKPGFRVNKIVDVTNGQYREKEISRQRKFTLPFKRQSIENWETFANLHGAGPKVFVKDFDEPECYHVCIPGQDFDPDRDQGDIDTFTIEMFENAIISNV